MRATVIIATACEAKRANDLRCAIESAEAPVLLVVNGTRYDPALRAELESKAEVEYLSEGNYANARHFGRTRVKTPFFCFLDDDDELLPGSVQKRLQPMLEDSTIDAVIGNAEPGAPRHLSNIHRIQEDPAAAMLEMNWLPSCAGLFRSESVGEEFFRPDLRHLEWTLTGFRLAISRKLNFIEAPTFRVNDTPESLSKQKAYFEAQVPAIESMLSLTNDPRLRRQIRRKLAAAHHDMAEHYLATDMSRARKHHVASLMGPGGLRYLAFTRKLIWHPNQSREAAR